MTSSSLRVWRGRGLLGLVLCAACPSTDQAFPVEVLFARCARVFRGPACELKADRVVALWVASTTLELSVSGEERRREVREDGTFLEVVVPEGASELLVRTPRKRPFKLALATTPRVPALEQALALRREGKLAEARTALEGMGEVPAPVALRKRSLLARLALAEGHGDEAVSIFSETMREHERAGDVSEAMLDGEALAWALVQRGERFAEARAALASLQDAALVNPEGAALLSYYQGLVFAESGDVRSALSALRIADARARRLDDRALIVSTEQLMALQLDALGRHDDALIRLEGLQGLVEDDACLRASLLTNLGWTSLNASHSPSSARTWLDGAAELFSTRCPNPSDHANVLTNLALAALLDGDLEGTEAALTKSRALAPDDTRLSLWRLDLEARVHLARKKPQPALEGFQRLQRLADAALSAEAAWRAAVGQARAATQLRQTNTALDAYRRAEALLDEEYRRIPFGEGLHTVLSEREQATGELLELLVGRGRLDEALATARHARTRALRHLVATERLSRLDEAQRDRWERAVASYAAARAELDRAARLDWQLPADKLAAAQASRQRQAQAMSSALDDALAELKVPPADVRAVERGELLLLMAPGNRRWLLFVATQAQISVHPMSLGPDAAPEAIGEAMAAIVAKPLSEAEDVSWLPWGPWNGFDPRAITIEDRPLGTSKRVSWRVDVPSGRARASSRHGSLLVADPTRNLPGARAEAMQVRPLLPAPTTELDGAQATVARVRNALREAKRFHYAGHAKVSGVGGFESELTLHDGRLAAADLLTFSDPPPPLVVLSGCETGKASEVGVEALGLAQAFVLAGSDEVIATEEPLDDALAAEAMSCLHARLSDASPAEALRLSMQDPSCAAIRHYRLYRQ